MNFCRSANSLNADFGKPDMANVSSLHQIGDRADCFLDGNCRIKTSRSVNVDIVDA